MLQMIGLQALQGYWTLSKTVIELLGVSEKTLNSVDTIQVNALSN